MKINIHGKSVLIDKEDYEKIKHFKWQIIKIKNIPPYVFAAGKQGTPSTVRMHRIILGAPRGSIIDHINGNPLDNRKINLRFCTQRQNMQNKKPHDGRKRKFSSNYKGVYKLKNKWRAYISYNYSTIHLGFFETESEAAKAYDFAASMIFKEFHRPNFKDMPNKKIENIDIISLFSIKS